MFLELRLKISFKYWVPTDDDEAMEIQGVMVDKGVHQLWVLPKLLQENLCQTAYE